MDSMACERRKAASREFFSAPLRELFSVDKSPKAR
jgi:hypothetical protein